MKLSKALLTLNEKTMIWRFIAFGLFSTCLFLLAFMSYIGMRKGIHSNIFTLKTYKNKSKHLDLIKDGIFWSDYAESFVPKGFLYSDSMALVRKLQHQHVKKLTKANRSYCGGGKNGIVELEDGTTMCVRYKKETHHIFAEALAFYLSRLLGMDNVPEVVLSKIEESSKQWEGSDFLKLKWQENDTVAMVNWVKNASSKTLMPLAIQNAYKTGKPVNSKIVQSSPLLNSRPSATAELIQWGTVIIFDNLISHDDRFIHYLPVTKGASGTQVSINKALFNSITSSNNKIWLIDNESAFCYRQKFEKDMIFPYIRSLKINDKMLKTMCIFQFSIVGKLRELSKYPSAFHHLWNYASFFEPLFKSFRKDSKLTVLAKLFNERLDDIILWIDLCKSLSIENSALHY